MAPRRRLLLCSTIHSRAASRWPRSRLHLLTRPPPAFQPSTRRTDININREATITTILNRYLHTTRRDSSQKRQPSWTTRRPGKPRRVDSGAASRPPTPPRNASSPLFLCLRPFPAPYLNSPRFANLQGGNKTASTSASIRDARRRPTSAERPT